MANDEHLNLLKQGVTMWNEWRSKHRDIIPDLRDANLTKASLRAVNLSRVNLQGADLTEADLYWAHLDRADLYGADLIGTILVEATLTEADLRAADLMRADLTKANLFAANLTAADFTGASLIGADLSETNLTRAKLNGVNLSGATLSGAILIEADLTQANLSGCHVFGISAWKLKLDQTIQSDLIITTVDEPTITVDNLEVAQFIYLLLHNEKIRDVIDTITSKAVLILGRFTSERKAILNTLREELRKRNYTPILFDFEKPSSKDFTETVMLLASMSRFIIVDLSDPNSSPHEVASIAEKLRSVPIKAIFCPTPEHRKEYPMYKDLQRLPHVLPTYRYESQAQLIAVLYEKVIQPAEKKVKELRADS